MSRVSINTAVVFAALVPAVHAQEATVTTIDGDRITGRIVSWRLNEQLVLKSNGTDPSQFQTRDIDQIEFPPTTSSPTGAMWSIALRDGSMWQADIAGGDE